MENNNNNNNNNNKDKRSNKERIYLLLLIGYILSSLALLAYFFYFQGALPASFSQVYNECISSIKDLIQDLKISYPGLETGESTLTTTLEKKVALEKDLEKANRKWWANILFPYAIAYPLCFFVSSPLNLLLGMLIAYGSEIILWIIFGS